MIASNQELVHTPFIPSGSWGPCAPLVWNNGSPTPLGGPFVSTDPAKAPNIRFSSSQFREQHLITSSIDIIKKRRLVDCIVVGGSRQETLDTVFVLLSTRQQCVPVFLRELVLPGVSPGFTVKDVTTELSEPRLTSCKTEM
ncbi:unnamed protein product [Schistosoma margrebowiei]|uniref:Uncharacterized protein n=1 Tax=Schistosoma margrebowiei TaxID=48269 RepID=A0A183MH70_9TREM|nr:unnamed protein product [Schistosoma margrebowiei]